MIMIIISKQSIHSKIKNYQILNFYFNLRVGRILIEQKA